MHKSPIDRTTVDMLDIRIVSNSPRTVVAVAIMYAGDGIHCPKLKLMRMRLIPRGDS